jgi:hypothetical protein
MQSFCANYLFFAFYLLKLYLKYIFTFFDEKKNQKEVTKQ